MAAVPGREEGEPAGQGLLPEDSPEAPTGPSSEEEAALLAQEREMGNISPALMHVETPPEEPGELPPMDDLVKRIPMPARDLMEELFRARFVTVKRIPRSALK